VNSELLRDEAERAIKNNAGLLGLYRLYTKYYRLTTNLPSTTVENSLQIGPFMQNKPNFQKAKMNVNSLITMNYKNFIPLAGQKNKANSNPIKANFQKAKIDAKCVFTKDYEEKCG